MYILYNNKLLKSKSWPIIRAPNCTQVPSTLDKLPQEEDPQSSYKTAAWRTLEMQWRASEEAGLPPPWKQDSVEKGEKIFKYLLTHGSLPHSFVIHKLWIHSLSICKFLIQNWASLKPLEKVELWMMQRTRRYTWPATESYPGKRMHRLVENHEHTSFLPTDLSTQWTRWPNYHFQKKKKSQVVKHFQTIHLEKDHLRRASTSEPVTTVEEVQWWPLPKWGLRLWPSEWALQVPLWGCRAMEAQTEGSLAPTMAELWKNFSVSLACGGKGHKSCLRVLGNVSS